MSQLLSNRRLLILLASLILLLLLLATLRSLQRATGVQAAVSDTSVAHLPVLRHDSTPTPVATPPLPPSAYEFIVQITPGGGINASTYNKDSFILRNNSSNGQKVKQVEIDLRTAVFPDMIFDPYGQ